MPANRGCSRSYTRADTNAARPDGVMGRAPGRARRGEFYGRRALAGPALPIFMTTRARPRPNREGQMNRITRTHGCLAAVVLGAVALVGAGRPEPAMEKWADPKLPVTAGLELWLDAARANGPALVPHDGKLEV